jgi:spoIIIJ-associated protein
VEARSEKRRSVVASGRTVEDAIANGLKMLGVGRDQVDIEIISEGSRGVLGFGAENAQIRISVEPQPEPEPELPPPTPKVTVAPQPPPPTPRPTTPAPAAPEEPEKPTVEQVGREVLIEVLHLMGVRAVVEAKLGYELADEDEEPPVVLNITGDDLGILIGRRGETLRALQYLIRLMVSHRLKHWSNLVVDVENYLVRRRNALESLALRVAEQVVHSGRSQALEPMPPYERRLVHIALRKHPKVTTHSVGEGEKRKVTIIPSK